MSSAVATRAAPVGRGTGSTRVELVVAQAGRATHAAGRSARATVAQRLRRPAPMPTTPCSAAALPRPARTHRRQTRRPPRRRSRRPTVRPIRACTAAPAAPPSPIGREVDGFGLGRRVADESRRPRDITARQRLVAREHRGRGREKRHRVGVANDGASRVAQSSADSATARRRRDRVQATSSR